jgi:hypothetical protein
MARFTSCIAAKCPFFFFSFSISKYRMNRTLEWLTKALFGCIASLLFSFSLTWAAQLDSGTSSPYTRIDKIEEAVRNWSPDRRLFVKGNIGVSEDQLRELSNWLRVNGPHWTIVVLESAAGEFYVSSDGREFADLGAVEHALGYELNNRTNFSSLIHPSTQERDGSILVVSLQERSLSYFSSDAQDKRGLGKSQWIGKLDQPAVKALRNGRRVVDAVKDTVKSITGGLDKIIATEILRRKQWQQAMWGLAVALILGMITALLGLLYFLHRRRRPIMEEARKNFREREASVRRETDGIDKLFIRNQEILGSREKIEERGYMGRTREVSEQAFNYVDDLFILSNEVNRVLGEARRLIEPQDFWGKLTNQLSGSRFHKALNLLSGAPLKFYKRDGLPWILRDRIAEQLGMEKPIDESKIPDEVALTFEDVYSAFKSRGIEASEALRIIESCLVEVHDRLTVAQASLQKGMEREKSLTESARRDGFFTVPNCIELLLPSIQADLKKANDLATFNAVEAVQESIPLAERKLAELHRLADQIDGLRQNAFPILQKAGEVLGGMQYETEWFNARLHELGAQADQAFAQAASESIASRIDEFNKVSNQLVQDADRSVRLATLIRDDSRPKLVALASSLDSARAKLAESSRIDIESVFREEGREPQKHLKQARDNLEAAHTMLSRGRVDAAEGALSTMEAELTRASQLVEASLHSAAVFNASKGNGLEVLAQLQSRSSEVRKAIDETQNHYAAAALTIQTLEPDKDQLLPASLPLYSLVDDGSRLLREANSRIEKASKDFGSARYLAAAEELSEAERLTAEAGDGFQRIDDHLARLSKLDILNRQRQADSEAKFDRLTNDARDHRVTATTIRELEQARYSLQASASELTRSGTDANPFDVSKNLDANEKLLKELVAKLESDLRGYAEAERAVNGAVRQWETAKQFVQRSQSDGIADSQRTLELNREVFGSGPSLDSVRRALQTPHGDWKAVDESATRLQAEISKLADALSTELQLAAQALRTFEEASQHVFAAEQWTGSWGVRVAGSHGVSELQQARSGLQAGNYSMVLQLASVAATAARAAVQQAEREVARRQMERQLEAERERRARDMARLQRNRDFGGGFGVGIGGGLGSVLGGAFGRSSSGSTGGGWSIPSPQQKPPPSTSSGDSGFSRSNW